MGSCGKGLIVSINTTFLLISVGVLAVGVLLRTNQGLVQTILTKVGDMIESVLQNAIKAAGPNSSTSVTSADIIDLIQALIQGISMPLIIAGSVMAAVALAAVIGASCTSGVLLVLYAIVLIAIILAQSVIVYLILVPGTPFETYFKTGLRSMLKFNEFQPYPYNNTISKLWLGVMQKMECCGIDSYRDFNDTQWKSPNWTSLTTPIVCCKDVQGVMEGLSHSLENPLNPSSLPNVTCAKTPNASNSNFERGCFKALREMVTTATVPKAVFFGIMCVGYLLEVVLLISAFSLIKESCCKNSVEPA